MKLVLQNPVSPFVVIQGFGVNGAYYQAHGINIIGHNGLDLEAYHGQPVYASHDGTCYPEIDTTGGNGVVIISDQPFDYSPQPCYFKTIYWHLTQDDVVVKTGQHVKTGDLIGYADNTGLSTGDHLHFGLKPVLQSGEAPFAWETQNPNNGYLGAIDPTPYFSQFNEDMQYGDSGPQILELQDKLASLGYFKGEPYPHYGDITRAAVFAFQKDHVQLSPWEKLQRGFKCGPKTRAALNSS